jgi:small subunit ribosomal protein S10
MSITKKDQAPKLRIKLKSYDVKMLESSMGKVVSLLIKSWATVKWPIPMPKKRKLYTVLKSNFKYKDAREQFERMTYSRLIDVVETWSKTIEYLQNLSIPVWVLVDVKVF